MADSSRNSPFAGAVKAARAINARRRIENAVLGAEKRAEESRRERAFSYLAERMREINGRLSAK